MTKPAETVPTPTTPPSGPITPTPPDSVKPDSVMRDGVDGVDDGHNVPERRLDSTEIADRVSSAKSVEKPKNEILAQLDDPSDLVEVVVLSDALMWNEPDGTKLGGFTHRGEFKGWKGLVPRSVAVRAAKVGDVATPQMVANGSVKLKAPDALPSATDDELSDMPEDQILAYIKQRPNEVLRVSDMELRRTAPRPNVMDAVDATVEAMGVDN